MRRIAIVNRGDAALRCLRAIRALREEDGSPLLGLALYTESDLDAPYVRLADEAIRLADGRGDLAAWLDRDSLFDALVAARADTVWPGWGFLAEDPAFVAGLEDRGITFIGPAAATLRQLGDKIAAKHTAERAGVPVVPWSHSALADVEAAHRAAAALGWPLVVKSAAGGGGRGIRMVASADGLAEALRAARAEARAAFGDERVFLERRIEGGRHIEVQIAGDVRGDVRALGLRDCSLQRRHQKLIEEAPPPGLGPDLAQQLADAAVRIARAVGYRGVGTVEFLVRGDRALFLEVNPRLQVEHAVTEETSGLDLVRLQLDLARARTLDSIGPIAATGHAIEARLCAENPAAGFAPAPGVVRRFDPASGPGIRIEAGVTTGGTVAAAFDSLVARVVARGRTREEARARLCCALAETELVLAGGTTNKGFLLDLLDHPDFRAGRIDTGWLDRRTNDARGATLPAPDPVLDGDALVAAAILAYRHMRESERRVFFADPSLADPARAPGSTGQELDLRHRGADIRFVVLAARPGRYRVRLGAREIAATLHTTGESAGWLALAGRMRQLAFDLDDDGVRLEINGHPRHFDAHSGGRVRAAAPGRVVRIDIRSGDRVTADQSLGLLEAMKMEAVLRSPVAGVVREVLVVAGQAVRAGELLVLIEAAAGDAALFPGPHESPELPPEAHPVGPTIDIVGAMLGYDAGPGELHALAMALDPGDEDPRPPVLVAETTGALAAPRMTGPLKSEFTPLPRDIADGKGSRPPETMLGAAPGEALRSPETMLDVPDGMPAAARPESTLLAEDLTAAVVAFADVESLFDRTPRSTAEGEPAPSNEACLRLYLRRLRERGEGLDAGFVAELGRALAHYGQPNLDPSPALERALLRIFAARRTGVLRHELARATIRRLESLSSAGFGLRHERALGNALDHIAGLRSTLPEALTDAAAEVRHAIFDAPRLRRRLGDLARRTEPDDRVLRAVRARFASFELEPIPAPPGLEAWFARDREGAGDDRVFVIADVRGRSHREGRLTRLHLAAFESAFHDATRFLRAVLAERDPERRLQWNRIWLLVEPRVALGPDTIDELVRRLAPATRRLGLERLVVRFPRLDPAYLDAPPCEVELAVADLTGTRLDVELREPRAEPLRPRSAYERRIGEARRRGFLPPHEVVPLLGEHFTEFDIDPAASEPCARAVSGRAPGEHAAGVIFGIVTAVTPEVPAGLPRVAILSDPTRSMGALGMPECDRLIAALDLAAAQGLAIDWIPLSSGARIALDSGTENLDATAKVVRRIVNFTRAGGAINIIVDGPNVGAQAYFDALATMMPESRGILIMTPRGSMVLTGRAALEASGSASAEDEVAIGGYERTAGPNGEAHHLARDLAAACRLLLEHHRHATPVPGETQPRRHATTDPESRDVATSPYPGGDAGGFTTVGEIFAEASNPGRRRPFAIRPVMRALIDADSVPLERWRDLDGGETAIVQDACLGGFPVCLIGVEGRNLPRLGRRPPDGPAEWTGSTLFPQSSRKIARAIAAASGVRPVVVLANLSGFDGSPESLRRLQLEHGAAIARAVVGFAGRLLFLVLSRYHGGAYVVFSNRLNPGLSAAALEGSYASVIGGSAAAAVVLTREVAQLAAADPEVARARRVVLASPSAATHAALDRARHEALGRARAAVATDFDATHDVARALRVGSIEAVLSIAHMRPWLIKRLTEPSSG